MNTAFPFSRPLYLMPKPAGAHCNLACDYCYYLEKLNLYPKGVQHVMTDELTEVYIREYIQSQYTTEVNFKWHGGEPLMRNDLEEVCAEIYAKGFPWGMVTNGLYLSPHRFVGLLKAGLHSITISLDGLEEDHNWMRGHKESFKRVDQAISMLVQVPQLTFDIVTCVNRRNYSKLNDIKEYLITKGVKRWRVFSVFPVGRAANDPDMKLTNGEFCGIFEFIKATRKEGRIRCNYGCEGFLGNSVCCIFNAFDRKYFHGHMLHHHTDGRISARSDHSCLLRNIITLCYFRIGSSYFKQEVSAVSEMVLDPFGISL